MKIKLNELLNLLTADITQPRSNTAVHLQLEYSTIKFYSQFQYVQELLEDLTRYQKKIFISLFT